MLISTDQSHRATLLDRFNRQITYLRLSVTNRCNLNCYYCKPKPSAINSQLNTLSQPPVTTLDEGLSLEKIVEIVTKLASLGINKVRLTGGEPLVRKDIVEIVAELNKINGLTDVSLTTNGILLAKLAKPLKEAGLKRINISLDTLNEDDYKRITGGGSLSDVLEGIAMAKSVGLNPIKINTVLLENQNEHQIAAIKDYCNEHGLHHRSIPFMSLTDGVKGVVEHSDRGHCPSCNRIRISSDGYILPCLFSDIKISLHDYPLEVALQKALFVKPLQGGVQNTTSMYQIGG